MDTDQPHSVSAPVEEQLLIKRTHIDKADDQDLVSCQSLCYVNVVEVWKEHLRNLKELLTEPDGPFKAEQEVNQILLREVDYFSHFTAY